MYLRHGFRQPNSEMKFWAPVKVIPPYGGRGCGPPGRRPLRVVAEGFINHPGTVSPAEAALRPGGSQALPTEAGSRPGTLVPRPPGKGPGRGIPFLVSGASRKESGSFFPAACTAGKILLTERSVDQRPPLGGLWSAPERSALPSSQRPLGAETGPPRPNVPRYIWAKLNFSQRTISLRRAAPPSTA